MSSPGGTSCGWWQSPLPALLSDVKDLMLRQVHDNLAEEGHGGLRYRHGAVFRFIDENGCRLTDLAVRAGLTKQGTGQVVSELEKLGYVARVPAPGDGRAKIIRLTPRGAACQATAAAVLGTIEKEWAERYGDDRISALRGVIEDIVLTQRPASSDPTT